MGVEAYRLAIKIEQKEKKQVVKEKLLELGGILVNEDQIYGRIDIDFYYKEGVIELLMENPYEISRGYKGKQENIDNVKNQLRIYMRIAKPNLEELIDKLMELLQNIDSYFGVKAVLDLITGKRIDINNYNEFKEDFINAKIEFESIYRGVPYPIKCHEVFPKYIEIMANNEDTALEVN